jgi:Tfp pilus assembly protein PilX
MKKVLISLVVVAVVAINVINVTVVLTKNSKMSSVTIENIQAMSECENSVKESGTKIVTTVCNRRTTKTGEKEKRWCTISSTTSCWYDNKGNGQSADEN